jgi:predicted phosphodiesterase
MRLIFPTDEHRPFQDDRAVALAMQLAHDFDPDLRIAGSDGVDFFAISHFDIDPARKTYDSLQKEIDSWKAGQRAWRDASPRARVVFLPGNHEDRLRRYLWNHPEIAGMDALRLENLFDFAGLGIEYDQQPYEMSELVLFDQVVVRHGKRVRRVSGASALAELVDERHAISVVTGHSHRGGTVLSTTRAGLRIAQEAFCLCSLTPTYVAHPDWQQGLVLLDVSADHLAIEAVPFTDFRSRKVAYWRGKEYIA